MPSMQTKFKREKACGKWLHCCRYCQRRMLVSSLVLSFTYRAAGFGLLDCVQINTDQHPIAFLVQPLISNHVPFDGCRSRFWWLPAFRWNVVSYLATVSLFHCLDYGEWQGTFEAQPLLTLVVTSPGITWFSGRIFVQIILISVVAATNLSPSTMCACPPKLDNGAHVIRWRAVLREVELGGGGLEACTSKYVFSTR